MARMFARLQREPSFAPSGDGWTGVLRPLASTTAGLLFGAALVGVAALRMAPEPVVTPAVDQPTPLAPIAAATTATAATAAPTVAAAATVAPAAAPAATPTAAPTPAPAAAQPPPPRATVYRYGGRTYAAVAAAAGSELTAPFAGRAEVRVYQLIDGQIRTGANAAGVPSFPYVIVRSGDRVFTLRPGALGTSSEVLVRDGQSVDGGTPLVRVTGSGASSWATFYDTALTAQVVASLVSAAGQDLDAAGLYAR